MVRVLKTQTVYSIGYILQEQFKDIPTRQVQVNTLSNEDKLCPICGSEMLAIGTEVIRKEIVYTPPKLECIEYVATTYACSKCKVLLTVGFVHNQTEVFVRKLPVFMPALKKYRHAFYKNSPSSTSCTA